MDTLYHYCSLSSLLAIVKTRSIRLSNIFYLNDGLEHRWYREQVAEELERRQVERSSPSAFYNGLREALLDNGLKHSFAFCMSSKRDSLSQWISYGDNGSGAAIGFNADWLRKATERVEHLSLDEVQYKQDLSGEIPAIEASVGGPSEEMHTVSDFQVFFTNWKAWQVAATFKNPAFKEEKEVRLLYQPPKDPHCTVLPVQDHLDIDYHPTASRLIPFAKLPLSTEEDPANDPIDEILLGPKNDEEVNALSIYMLLEQYGFSLKEKKIAPSKASYR